MMSATKSEGAPRYYDIEQHRRSINRKMWVVIGGSCITSILALVVAFAAVVRPVPVVVFDSEGRPIVFEETRRPSTEVTRVRVEHFADTFFEHWLGIDSTRLQEDFTRAVNMMTPQAREIALHEDAEIQRRLAYQDKNVRSHFESPYMRVGEFSPEGTDDIYLWKTAKQVFAPIIGQAEKPVEQWIYAKLIVRRVPVTTQSPYGLLARYVESHVFESPEALNQYLRKSAAGGS